MDLKQYLSFFEHGLSGDLLQKFKEAQNGETEKINIAETKLYEYWLNLKEKCGM